MEKTSIDLATLYHENTKLYPHLVPKLVPSDRELAQFMLKEKKNYPLAEKIKLKPSKSGVKYSLEEVLLKRRSIRNFVSQPVPFSKISKLLLLSYGNSGKIYLRGEEKVYKLRTAPSAGAFFACEVYLIAINIKGLKRGVYHFYPDEEQLECLRIEENINEEFITCLTQPELFSNIASAIVITGIYSKICFKYGLRGYRYILLDAGHIGENIYLAGTALGLGVVGVCGFYDDKVSELLMLRNAQELPVYILLVGNRKR